MEIASLAKRRYTTKAFDASRRIPQAAIDTLLEQLRHSPSSVNSQPWHFIVASTDEGKARIAKGTEGGFAYNAAKVLKASHVIVLCSRTEDAKIGQDNSRRGYVALHRFDQKDLQHWMEKQTYLALGTLLLGAASLGLDATPMEGFDFRKLDEELGLRANGYSSLVLVALGYRDDSDFNAKLPKSRLPSERIYTYL